MTDVSLMAWPTLAGLGAAFVGAVVAAWKARGHRIRRALVCVLALLLLVANVAAGFNRYFHYLPTVGSLLGERAAYETSRSGFRRAIHMAGTSHTAAAPAHGVVVLEDIPGAVSGFHARPAQVYLPPAWFAVPRPTLPVIELLHGVPGTPYDWTRAASADVTAERWAAAHGGVAPIIVMPDTNGGFTDDTECIDGPLGRAETYLTVDVPAFVVAHFGAATDRTMWAVAGASEGGYCALDLGLRHRDRYSMLMDFSGLDQPTHAGGLLKLFGRSPINVRDHSPLLILHNLPPGPPIAAWFEVGGADGGTMRAVQRAELAARQAGLETKLVLQPDAHHTWRVWRTAFEDALPWAVAHFDEAAKPVPKPAPASAR
jgi:S-formylglutathione hydrolase FrmB